MTKQEHIKKTVKALTKNQVDIVEVLGEITNKDSGIIIRILKNIDGIISYIRFITKVIFLILVLVQTMLYDLYFSEPLSNLISRINITWSNYPIWIKQTILTSILLIPATVISMLIYRWIVNKIEK